MASRAGCPPLFAYSSNNLHPMLLSFLSRREADPRFERSTLRLHALPRAGHPWEENYPPPPRRWGGGPGGRPQQRMAPALPFLVAVPVLLLLPLAPTEVGQGA